MTMETTTTIKGKEYRIRLQFETITPERAEDLLGTTIGNRGIGLAQVDRYIRAMTADQWYLECSPIKISDTGKLIDGHHRLEAVKASGVAQVFLVMYGLPEFVFTALDQNRPRSTKDTFTVKGEASSRDLASAVQHLWRFIHSVSTRITCSNIEANDLLNQHPGMRQSIIESNHMKIQIQSPKGLMCALHYVLTAYDPKNAKAFFDGVIWGKGDIIADPTDPRTKLRTKIQQEARSIAFSEGGRTRGSTWNELKVSFWVIEAWQCFLDGKPLSAWSGSSSERNVLSSLYSMAQDVHARALRGDFISADHGSPSAHTVGQAIVNLMENRTTWTGKTADLASVISSDYGLPIMTTRKFAYEMYKLATNTVLEEHSISVTKYKHRGYMMTKLTKPLQINSRHAGSLDGR